MRSLAGLAGLTILAALSLTACGDSGDTATDSSSTGTKCSYSADGREASKKVDPPPSTATESGDVAVTIDTSVGKIAATLDAASAPCTVNSFLSLAEQGYFDATQCHRLVTPPASIAVLQCGDPSASGTGGPGYSFPDELSGKESYGAGTLAMANAGPDTNGSQFFMVYADSTLPPSYTVFGHLDDASVKVLEQVAAQGSDNAFGANDGHPKEKVEITGVTVG